MTSPEGSYSSQMGTPENVGVIGVAIFPERVHPMLLRPRPQQLAPRPRRYGYDEGRLRDRRHHNAH